MKFGFRNTFQAIVISAIIVAPVVTAIYFLFGIEIWQDFFPNFLATMLGVVVGIPIAIGINNQQEAAREKNQKEMIIPLLREELLVNVGHLSSWQKSDFQKLETVYTGIFLEDSAWLAFSDSGELAFIKDPELLKKISYAYGNVRILKQLSERYMDLVRLSDQKERELLQIPVAYLISKGIDTALEDISTALKALK